MIRFFVRAAALSKLIAACLTIILQNDYSSIIINAQLIDVGLTYDHFLSILTMFAWRIYGLSYDVTILHMFSATGLEI